MENFEPPRAGKKVFEPEGARELMRGWIIHAHKGRDRHDAAARGCDACRYWFGVPALTLAAIAGTSVFASLQENQLPPLLAIMIGLVSMGSAVLMSLQTFLDFAGRAERHRIAGVKYKAIVREIEQKVSSPTPDSAGWDACLDELRRRLDALEEDSPVVPQKVYDRVEARYSKVEIVTAALDLSK